MATRHILAKNQHSETLELSKLAVLEVLNRAWFHEKQNFSFNFSIVWNYNYLTSTTTLRFQSMGLRLHEIFSISLVVPRNFLHKNAIFYVKPSSKWRRHQIFRQNDARCFETRAFLVFFVRFYVKSLSKCLSFTKNFSKWLKFKRTWKTETCK